MSKASIVAQTLIIASITFSVGVAVGMRDADQPRDAIVAVHGCPGAVNESIGVGNGAHQALGVQCEDGSGYKVVVK